MADNGTRSWDCPQKMSETFNKMADLLEPEGAWVRGRFAKNKQGQDTNKRTSAVCWCTVGAMNQVLGQPLARYNPSIPEVIFLEKFLNTSVVFWNDTIVDSQEDVVSTLRTAAKLVLENKSE